MTKLKSKGFTLVEIMVAISIFAIVALVTTNAFITADRISKKAQALKTVIDNLHFALNAVSFNLQQGGTYHCLDSLTEVAAAPTNPLFKNSGRNCPNGGPAIVFRSPKSGSNPHIIIYKLQDDKLWYWESELLKDFVPLTVDKLKIDNLKFYVSNTEAGDSDMPRVFFTISGVAALGQSFQTKFQLQTLVSERI